jgi:uncharacterized protein (DUF362 family)
VTEQGLTRRRFIKTAMVGAGLMVVPRWLSSASGKGEKSSKDTTKAAIADSVAGEPEPTPKDCDLVVVTGSAAAAVSKGLSALGGMDRFVKKGDVVVLKPNMSFANPPDWGTTTSPELVRAVAEECLSAGAKKVIVVDHTLRDPRSCLERTEIEKTCKGLRGVSVIALTSEKQFEGIQVPQGKDLKTTQVAKVVTKADVLINLPIAKSHSASGVSLGMKNLMGLVWDRQYFHQKADLQQAIADLSTVIRPDLIILDATRVLERGGPGGPGTVKRIDTVVMGTDPVAVDSYGVQLGNWYGRSWTGDKVMHVAVAHKMGLGQIDVSKLSVVNLKA